MDRRGAIWLLLAALIPVLVLGLSFAGQAGIAQADHAWPRGRPTPTPHPGLLAEPGVVYKIDPLLLRAVLEDPQGLHRFIVHLRPADPAGLVQPSMTRMERRRAVVSRLQAIAQTSQQRVRSLLEKGRIAGQVESFKSFWIFNGLVVTADKQTLFELAALPEVQAVRADRKYWLPEPDQVDGTYTTNPEEGIDWGIERIRANMVWDALGMDGTGVVIASMDTGVDWLHPDLQSSYRGYNAKGVPIHVGNWYSATDEDYVYPGDGHGHGTHTTATMVGQNGVGVAPGAKWIAVKVFHNQGFTYDSWIHDAFQWVLAPAGDPDLAPDIVNGSWGNSISDDVSLQPDIRALRAAGIIPVFAVGNDGPEPASLGAPASYPEVIAVGAVDQDGKVANFSSRGPSPWGEIKPEVVAPGTVVLSSVPGGARQAWNGTSMAAPHVSGVVALMLQARPNLTFEKIEDVLKSTAVPIGQPVPNNAAGWGRVDAYAAVASVMDVGVLRGRVMRAIDQQPVAGATVSVAVRDGEPFAHTTTNVDGYYELTLPPGPYELYVSAFAYQTAVARGIRVSQNAHLTRDISLVLRPAGVLFGQVTDEVTDGPLPATVYVMDTPVVVSTDPATGRYSVPLPPGEYRLKVVSHKHRIGRASGVSIDVDQTTIQSFKLPRAPSILVVDSGAWYYGSQIRFFEQALDDLDYTYDVWWIKDLSQDLPAADNLKPYDVTIWSAPRDAPGFIGASDTITNYLEAGGRLLLTGQDVGYWDGGGSQNFFASYYRDYLYSAYIRDDAGTRALRGEANTTFEGLSLDLGRADSAHNQRFPDEIAPLNQEHAQVILRYEGGGPAALAIRQCLPYRAVYLAFGFEGVQGRAQRAELLRRALSTLMAPPPALGVTVTADIDRQIAPAGSMVRHVATVRNTGSTDDLFLLSLEGSTWPVSLWAGDFSQQLTGGLRIASCEAISVGVQVEIPSGTDRDQSNPVWLRARSRSTIDRQRASASLQLLTKTPAPVLLVDDDRWFNVEERYIDALRLLDVGYDHWPVGWNGDNGLGTPSPETLVMYPAVIWFTGYDWFQTLTRHDETLLANYLLQGGRLFLSAQDYFYTNGLTDFGRGYLGVITYTEDLTSTVISGIAGNPISHGLGPYTLDYPFTNHSDAIEPAPGAMAVFRGSKNWPVATAYAPKDKLFKSVFFSFPFEALSRPAASTVLGRVIDWFSPLHRSAVRFDRSVASEGDRLTVTVTLRNDSDRPAGEVSMAAYLPSQADYVIGSLGDGEYDPGARMMRWQGTVGPGEAVTVSYQIQLAPSILDGTTLQHQVDIIDSWGLKLTRYATIRVDAPDLSASSMWVDHERAQIGDILRYGILLRNAGTVDGGIMTMTDRLSPAIELIAGTLTASSGRVTSDGRQVVWQGHVLRDAPVSIRYQARVIRAGKIVNTAQIDDGTGVITEPSVVTVVPTRMYLPLFTWPASGE